MECPECSAELIHHDSYGLFTARQSGEKFGDIFKCPNCEGFETEEEAREYDPDCNGDWEEIMCRSIFGNGCFYTDKAGNLHEGYPY